MQIARDMSGFTLGEADVLRYAMGKKKADLLKEQREKFIKGAVNKEIDAEDAAAVFDLLEPFGRYAFPKAHNTAYAILSYQMAYLKTHYPREFMAALMTGESDYSDKIMKYIAECHKVAEFLGIKIDVLPPDINSSETDFTVVVPPRPRGGQTDSPWVPPVDGGGDIRFGLAAVKNASDTAIQAIVEERGKGGSFKSLQDFCERATAKSVNRRTIESLIMAGAFDSLGGHRAQYMASLDQVLKAVQSSQKDLEKGQMSLFGSVVEETTSSIQGPSIQVELADVPEWPYDEVLKHEKEYLGFYLSGHPLEQYEDILNYYTTATSQTLAEHPNGTEIYVIGLIASVRLTKTKKGGEPMAIVVIEDLEGVTDVVVFPEAYKISKTAIEEGSVVWIRGNVSQGRRKNGADDDEMEEDVRQIQAAEVLPIDQVVERMTSAIEVAIPEVDNQQKIHALQAICLQNRGEYDLILRLRSPKYGEVIAQCSSRYNISYHPSLVSEIEGLFGPDCVKRSNRTARVGERLQYGSYV